MDNEWQAGFKLSNGDVVVGQWRPETAKDAVTRQKSLQKSRLTS
jgi:hypothetical protein